MQYSWSKNASLHIQPRVLLWYQEIEIKKAYLGSGLSRAFNFNARGVGYRIYASVGNFPLSASGARAAWSMAQASIIILITSDCLQPWFPSFMINVCMSIMPQGSVKFLSEYVKYFLISLLKERKNNCSSIINSFSQECFLVDKSKQKCQFLALN